MQKGIQREHVFPCNRKKIFQWLIDDFKFINKIEGDVEAGFERENSNYFLEIVTLKKDEEFSIKMITPKDTYIQTYLFKDEDMGKARMKYVELYEASSFLRSLNFTLVRIINRRKYHKQIKEMFISIGEKINGAE